MTPYTVRPLTPTDRSLVTPPLVREWGATAVVALSLGGVVTESRKIKSEIPEEGLDGIPVRDELELSMELP